MVTIATDYQSRVYHFVIHTIESWFILYTMTVCNEMLLLLAMINHIANDC